MVQLVRVKTMIRILCFHFYWNIISHSFVIFFTIDIQQEGRRKIIFLLPVNLYAIRRRILSE
jgi:hypothetical protein